MRTMSCRAKLVVDCIRISLLGSLTPEWHYPWIFLTVYHTYGHPFLFQTEELQDQIELVSFRRLDIRDFNRTSMLSTIPPEENGTIDNHNNSHIYKTATGGIVHLILD